MMGLLMGEKDPAGLVKRIQELERRLSVLEVASNTGDLAAQLGFDAFGVRARVHNSGAISVPDSTVTYLTFDSESFDTDQIHSAVSDTDRLTCRTAGLYVIVGDVVWAANGTGDRMVGIYYNSGATGLATISYPGFASSNNRQSVSTIHYLSVGDYVRLGAYQTSGGALNV